MQQRRRCAAVATAACLVLTACAGPVTSGDAPAHQEPDAEPSLRFTASGDFSATEEAQATLEQIDALDVDLHLALGDLSYGETGEEANGASS